MSRETTTNPEPGERPGRRAFFAALVGLGAGVWALATRTVRRGGRRGPIEKELGEADLRGPHDLAG